MSLQQNNCKSAASAKCINLLSHAPRKTPFSYLRAETWKADLPLGVFISLQPAVSVIHTNQVSDGEVLHTHVGKNKAEINSLKYTSKPENLYSTTPLLHWIWKKILVSQPLKRDPQVSDHKINQSVFKTICKIVSFVSKLH